MFEVDEPVKKQRAVFLDRVKPQYTIQKSREFHFSVRIEPTKCFRDGNAENPIGNVSDCLLGKDEIPAKTVAVASGDVPGKALPSTKIFKRNSVSIRTNRFLLNGHGDNGLDHGCAKVRGMKKPCVTDPRNRVGNRGSKEAIVIENRAQTEGVQRGKNAKKESPTAELILCSTTKGHHEDEHAPKA